MVFCQRCKDSLLLKPIFTFTGLSDLKSNLLVQSYGPVAEGDGVAEAGLPLHVLLGHVHDDLGTLGIWMEEERIDGN